MEVRYSNTFGDVIRFNLYHLPRMGVMQALYVALVAMHVYTFGPVVAKLDDSMAMKVTVFLTMFLIFAAILILVQFLLLVFSYRPSKNKALFTEHVVRVSEDGLVEETAYGSAASTWSGIPKVGQNGRYIFVYVQQNVAHIIPKRAFPAPADAAKFAEFVSSHAIAARHA